MSFFGSHHSGDSFVPIKQIEPPRRLPNWKMMYWTQVGNNLVVKVKFLNLKAYYEGVKILVYRNMTAVQLYTHRELDPHFIDQPGALCPIARFHPNPEGWELALTVARLL